MAYGKTKAGMLIGFTGITLVILALFVPTSTIFFALLMGLLFVIPMLALVSIVMIGASTISKKLRKPSKPEEKDVVIPTN
jgi:ABC-type uncharacterized transport system permease subunit